MFLKNAKGESKLFIFKTCTNLIRELKTYHWGNSDIPVKKDDHSLDELRYYIMTRPENKAQKQEMSLVEKEKEKMLRRLKTVRF